MRVLLDTNVVVFSDRAPERLRNLRSVLEEAELLLSPVVTWELAIKVSTGKLHLRASPDEYVDRARRALGAAWLPMTSRHASGVVSLPWHHRDPFDRALVATAQVEGLALATTDRSLTRYDVDVLLP